MSNDGVVDGNLVKTIVTRVIKKHGHGAEDAKKKDIEPDPVVTVADPGTQ